MVLTLMLRPEEIRRIWRISLLRMFRYGYVCPAHCFRQPISWKKTDYLKMRAERYASFDSGEGKAFEDGKLSLKIFVQLLWLTVNPTVQRKAGIV